MRDKSCSSNLISFQDKVAHQADQGKPVDVIFLDFNKSESEILLLSLPGSFWTKGPSHRHIMGWVNNQLMGLVHRVTVNGAGMGLVTCHQWGSTGLHPRPCVHQHLQK